MKSLFSLSPVLVLCLFFVQIGVQAQPIPTPSPENWNEPRFPSEVILQRHVSAIRIHEEGEAALRGGGAYRFENVQAYEFNRKGQLTRRIEMEGQDTALVRTYTYTELGSLQWENIDDRSWNKVYRSGYRFNHQQQIYQKKDYEMVNADDAMVLGTENYVYDRNNRLRTVRYLEQGRLISHRSYDYDSQGRLSGLITHDEEGNPVETVLYDYAPSGKVSRISHQGEHGLLQTYEYTYDRQERLVKVSWLEDNQLQGETFYTYDPEGLPETMETRMTPRAGGHTRYAKINYDFNAYY